MEAMGEYSAADLADKQWWWRRRRLQARLRCSQRGRWLWGIRPRSQASAILSACGGDEREELIVPVRFMASFDEPAIEMRQRAC